MPVSAIKRPRTAQKSMWKKVRWLPSVTPAPPLLQRHGLANGRIPTAQMVRAARPRRALASRQLAAAAAGCRRDRRENGGGFARARASVLHRG
jgi:hypothetical protein